MCLRDFEEAYGPADPRTLATLGSLAILFADQRKYDEAEPMYRRALAGEEALGPAHPQTLNTVGNLANLLRMQGKYDEAELLHRRACGQGAGARAGAPESTLNSEQVGNLAVLLKNQGKYEEAEPLYRRDLAGCEEVHGPAHPSTLMTVGNLASPFAQQGKLDEAEPLFRRELAGEEEALGPAHPETLGRWAIWRSCSGERATPRPRQSCARLTGSRRRRCSIEGIVRHYFQNARSHALGITRRGPSPPLYPRL